MKINFQYGHWHAWQVRSGILLSDEANKVLRGFSTADGCVNWLYMSGYKDAARALNKHIKGEIT